MLASRPHGALVREPYIFYSGAHRRLRHFGCAPTVEMSTGLLVDIWSCWVFRVSRIGVGVYGRKGRIKSQGPVGKSPLDFGIGP